QFDANQQPVRNCHSHSECCSRHCDDMRVIQVGQPAVGYCSEPQVCIGRIGLNEERCGPAQCAQIQLAISSIPNAPFRNVQLEPVGLYCLVPQVAADPNTSDPSTEQMQASIQGDKCQIQVDEADNSFFVNADAQMRGFEYVAASHSPSGNF